MRLAVLVAFTSLLLMSSGCKGACRQLSEKQCDCTNSTTERTNCLQIAANKENSGVVLTAADEARCQGLVEQCDCRLLDTPAGKERCGIAISADGGF